MCLLHNYLGQLGLKVTNTTRPSQSMANLQGHTKIKGAVFKAAFKKTLEAILNTAFKQKSSHLEGRIQNNP